MQYIWVDYKEGHGFEPHMTFVKAEREEADFEIQDLKDHGFKAKRGEKFPARKEA